MLVSYCKNVRSKYLRQRCKFDCMQKRAFLYHQTRTLRMALIARRFCGGATLRASLLSRTRGATTEHSSIALHLHSASSRACICSSLWSIAADPMSRRGLYCKRTWYASPCWIFTTMAPTAERCPCAASCSHRTVP